MGMLVEQLVALAAVVIVGGALVTMVYRFMTGSRREEKQLAELTAEFKTKKKS